MTRKCRYTKQISPLLDGGLPSNKERSMRAHISACPTCRQEIADLQQVDALLTMVPQIEPSRGFEQTFFRKVAALEEKTAARQRFWASLFSGWRPVAAAGTAAILIGVLTFYAGVDDPGPGPADLMIVEQMELFQEYEIIEHLDLMEHWEEITAMAERS